jgi:adenine-specific DNA methylase
MEYPKRLIEVDLPIRRISAHARREKSIRHGHISTLHIWWARRPLAACRAVICASLWPDPADELCPQAFREAAERELRAFAQAAISTREVADVCGAKSWKRYGELAKTDRPMDLKTLPPRTSNGARKDSPPTDLERLRGLLLDFIADFAAWEASTNPVFLKTARNLTRAAHEALGGAPGTRPLVVDPFAGGGSIPLEALRVGADAFASDLNPVAVLLNKVVLEYIPKYGQRLADEVRKWGQWVKEQAEKELAQFYPKDPPTKDNPHGATPIAYLWARTILSEGPTQHIDKAGNIVVPPTGDDQPFDATPLPPVEVPLLRSLWLAKKAGRRRGLRWVRDKAGRVQTETVDVTYVIDGQRVVKRVRRPLLEIFEPKNEREVEAGTVARGSATCPVTGYTTKVDSVRAQLKQRRGGAADARLFAVVTTRDHEQGRFYRLPTKVDQAAFDAAAAELERREREDGTERSAAGRAAGRRSAAASATGSGNHLSLVPDEVISLNELRRISVPIYGMERWGDLFSPRQALALTTLARLTREAGEQMASADNPVLAEAVQTCLGLLLGRQANASASLSRVDITRETVQGLYARQAIGMVWDFVEVNPFSGFSGGWDGALTWVAGVCDSNAPLAGIVGHIEQAFATNHPLPDDAAAAFVTDPPYYDAVPYAYLSDFFYVWLRRTLADVHPSLFREAGVPKDAEIVVDRPHQLSQSTKDIAFYERELTKAFAEGRRITRPDGVGTIVFASKTTASWEAILKAVIDAGWVITGSWPIDTEMETRVAAQGQARLASSVHIVCRPRENPDGSLRTAEVGDWREVLAELPKRIHEWMPRLAREGMVGADAIFACLGPALEVFSRYDRVEKASGEQVSLREYLEQVWAAVSQEALRMVFEGADATGFEEDARLTAMWLWTLQTNSEGGRQKAEGEDEEEEAEEDESGGRKKKPNGGYALEFDAARKIAQGLGAHLENLTSVVEVKGDTARLLAVSERTAHLFGRARGDAPAAGRRKKAKQMKLSFAEEVERAEAEAGWGEKGAPKVGQTTLDRVHQAMILFARERSEALRRFLVEEGVGRDGKFWTLAQALSALYPAGSVERRWVDGVLARKKGLGL